jgi:hypothetical protein
MAVSMTRRTRRRRPRSAALITRAGRREEPLAGPREPEGPSGPILANRRSRLYHRPDYPPLPGRFPPEPRPVRNPRGRRAGGLPRREGLPVARGASASPGTPRSSTSAGGRCRWPTSSTGSRARGGRHVGLAPSGSARGGRGRHGLGRSGRAARPGRGAVTAAASNVLATRSSVSPVAFRPAAMRMAAVPVAELAQRGVLGVGGRREGVPVAQLRHPDALPAELRRGRLATRARAAQVRGPEGRRALPADLRVPTRGRWTANGSRWRASARP